MKKTIWAALAIGVIIGSVLLFLNSDPETSAMEDHSEQGTKQSEPIQRNMTDALQSEGDRVRQDVVDTSEKALQSDIENASQDALNAVSEALGLDTGGNDLPDVGNDTQTGVNGQ